MPGLSFRKDLESEISVKSKIKSFWIRFINVRLGTATGVFTRPYGCEYGGVDGEDEKES
jgi:hypothetical protein